LFCLDKNIQKERSLLPTSKTEDVFSPAIMKTLERMKHSTASSSRSGEVIAGGVNSDAGPANHFPSAKKSTKRQSNSYFSASPPNTASDLDIESMFQDDDDHSDIESNGHSEIDSNRSAEFEGRATNGTLDADAFDADAADAYDTPDIETATPAAANGHTASNVPKADDTSLDAPNGDNASGLPLPNKTTWPTWLSMAFPHLETVSTNSRWSLLIAKLVLFELSLGGSATVSFRVITGC
jgi:hypothetical protein